MCMYACVCVCFYIMFICTMKGTLKVGGIFHRQSHQQSSPRARGAALLLCESARPRIVRFTVKEAEKGLARPGSTTKGEPFEKSFNVMIIIVARQKGTAKQGQITGNGTLAYYDGKTGWDESLSR